MSSNAFARGFEHDETEAACLKDRTREEQRTAALHFRDWSIGILQTSLDALVRERAREEVRRYHIVSDLKAIDWKERHQDACELFALIDREIDALRKRIADYPVPA